MNYIDGRNTFPLPVYFIGDYGAGAPKVLSVAAKDSANLGFKMDGLKVCDNLFWLKGSGKFTLHGLSVAYLSGKQSASGQPYGTYSQDDVDALRALAEEHGIVDIFLTNDWPSGILNGVPTTDIPPEIPDLSGTDSTISELVAEIKPRYHIAGTRGVFYSREPYTNVDAVHVTRFIGLAPVGNADKQKFIHALSPTPAATMAATEISMKPTNTTSSPYASLNNTSHEGKRSSEDISDSQYWRYDVSKKRQKHGDGDRLCFKFVSLGSCPRGEQCHFRHDVEAREQSLRGVCFDFMNKGKCERGPDCNFKHSLQEGGNGSVRRPKANNDRSKECWFCLSSPNVESHLITSIGEHCYCALAKGPLVPDHVLILPVEHLPNTLSSPQECETDIVKFQNSLRSYFKEQAKEVVFFEWIFIRGTHANLQAIPIPSSRAASLPVVFNLAAERMGFKFQIFKNDTISEGRNILRKQFNRNCSLFYVELPGGTILSHAVEEGEKFPAQFGREVLAGLLNMADRADWRNCKLSKDEEIKMAENFKNSFEKYDPNQ